MRARRQGTDRALADEAADADAERMRRALAAYGVDGLTTPGRSRGGKHARRHGRRAGWTAAGAVLVLCVASAAVAFEDRGAAPQAAATTDPALEVRSATASQALLPGRTATGSVLVSNRRSGPARVAEVVFGAPTSDACASTGVALAATLPPSPETPLEVAAGGTATVEWTAYMDGEGEDACQGAVLTSEVLLDGEPSGVVRLTAGTLEPPPAPTGGLTTSTRAAVQWAPSQAADPGWVLERAVAGTTDWQPACGSSAQRPLRTLSCTDTGLTRSTAYVYRLTLRTGHWQATSRPSRPVTTQARPSA